MPELSSEVPFPISNTLGLHSNARFGATVCNLDELKRVLARYRTLKTKFVALGAGSNIVPLQSVDAFVCQIDIQGIDIVQEDQSIVKVRVGAGVNWHAWVSMCLETGWYGLENLTMIPGNVGAAPIQNIGAYGVEVGSFVTNVHCLNLAGETMVLARQECEFLYRSSIFKRRPELIVTAVEFELSKTARPFADYPGLRDKLAGTNSPTAIDVSRAVEQIRTQKLPDPRQHPNAGSFFKNPIVEVASANTLAEKLLSLQRYELSGGSHVKLSAAQLIDELGWKERGTESVGCWQKQPLVIVNQGLKRGEDLLRFAALIQDDVFKAYGITLELEPVVLT